MIVACLALTVMFSSCKKSPDIQEEDNSVATIFHGGNQEPTTNEVLIYPNPSEGEVNFSVTQNSNVTVFDYTARLIDEFSISANETRTVNYAPNRYVVKVESNGNTPVYTILLVTD